MSSSRYRVEAEASEAGLRPMWSVRVTDGWTGEEIASYPPTFHTEAEAREQGEFEIRNFERRKRGRWDLR